MAAVDAHFHVLAVDDNLIDRKLIETLLKSSSFQVTAVDSGSKALELLGLHRDDDNDRGSDGSTGFCPDHPKMDYDNQETVVNLIITDYCMPGMTGYDLLRKIKGSKTLRNIPVVIMSSENIPSRINRCLLEGAEEFLLKPVQLSDVHDKITPRLLNRKSGDGHHFEDQRRKRKGDDECVSPIKSRIRFTT